MIDRLFLETNPNSSSRHNPYSHSVTLIDFEASPGSFPSMSTSSSKAFASNLVSPLLSINGRKSRYGVSYLRNICAQAGLAVTETSIDEDVQSVDAKIDFQIGNVYVQIKCIGNSILDSPNDIVIQLKKNWIENWRPIRLPLYIVAVLVEDDYHDKWISHEPTYTTHKANAYWIKFDREIKGKTVRIPRANRLSMDTFNSWSSDLDGAFATVVVP